MDLWQTLGLSRVMGMALGTAGLALAIISGLVLVWRRSHEPRSVGVRLTDRD
jgi:hypothetical protein